MTDLYLVEHSHTGIVTGLASCVTRRQVAVKQRKDRLPQVLRRLHTLL